jgi:DNA-binding LacI/PurR family transcriptional regulator
MGGSLRSQYDVGSRLAAGMLIEHILRTDPIDAIMTFSDGIVFSVAAGCKLLGKVPNKDIAIVGYDNYWKDCREREWAGVTPLATVDKHNRRIGEELLRLLLDRIEGRVDSTPQRRVVTPELKIIQDDWHR